MTGQPRRLPTGGRIDRARPLKLRFDGRVLDAWQGDTLASAMLANGETIVGRSFKYHRPRGIFGLGVEEPNALVQLRSGARSEPNSRATVVEAYDGLEASGQNAFPNVRFDLGAVNQLLSPFLSAGFYYKTFIGPGRGTRSWMFFEHFIRKAAGMGRAVKLADPDAYEKVNSHCDVLVVGAGPAGLSAALAAARAGSRVMLAEQDFALGGSLLLNDAGGPADVWLEAVKEELSANANVTILTRTTAFGAYEQDVCGLVERVWDHVAVPPEGQPRQRYWLIRAKRTIMATGAIEQPLVFAGNDRPAIMLASAVRGYLNRYAVLAGKSAVVATNNDSAWATACDLAGAGAKVTLVDARSQVAGELVAKAKARSIEIFLGAYVTRATGSRKVSGVEVASIDADGLPRDARTINCDLVAVSGGWAPVLHLWSHRFGRPVFDQAKRCFLPKADAGSSFRCVGSATACGALEAAIAQGFEEGVAAACAAGSSAPARQPPEIGFVPFADDWTLGLQPARPSATKKAPGKAFIDLQHDVTADDIDLAHREGYVSVEHLKRYTTTGMANDQGKTSNLNALARMAVLKNVDIPEVGTTTFRPPFTPVSIGALVGREHGLHFRPIRRSALHQQHVDAGARMIEAGAWMRPWFYPQHGAENLRQAYAREAEHVRNHVGIVDVSTLGKIAVQGPDAAGLLNRVYVNGWSNLAIGRLRYGVMLREDGFVMDDGATARLGEHDYFMTTTTANAGPVLAFMEHLLQTAWRDLRVHVTSVTDQWAAIAVAGPKSRRLLQVVAPAADLSPEALPNNHFVHAELSGTKIRIHRMSYSGELAYEVYVPSTYAHAAWDRLVEAGAPLDLKPYGTEAMGALRIEKGHIAGAEIDGRTTLKDLGLPGLASAKKPFVGSVLRGRRLLEDPARPSIVGLVIDGDAGTRAGALLYPAHGPTKGHGEGHVTSATWSPALDKHIAMALLSRGPQRMGETIRCVDFVGDLTVTAKIVSHHFFDPEGTRQNA